MSLKKSPVLAGLVNGPAGDSPYFKGRPFFYQSWQVATRWCFGVNHITGGVGLGDGLLVCPCAFALVSLSWS